MKRLTLALLFALFFHGILFYLPYQIVPPKEKDTIYRHQSVTITMSYKSIPEPQPQKAPPKRVTPEKKKTKTPEISSTVITKPKPIRHKKPMKPNKKSNSSKPPLKSIHPLPAPKQRKVAIPVKQEQKSFPLEEQTLKKQNTASPTKRLKIYDPEYKKNPLPTYPKKAIRRGYGGIVELKVSLTEKGKVLQIDIHKSSGYKILDAQAVKTVKRWQFEPRKKNDVATASQVIVPICFKLN